MHSYGHSLAPERVVQVQKITNIGFFSPKPYLKGVDQDFLFDREFFLVEILNVENGLAFRTTHFSQYWKTWKSLKQ